MLKGLLRKSIFFVAISLSFLVAFLAYSLINLHCCALLSCRCSLDSTIVVGRADFWSAAGDDGGSATHVQLALADAEQLAAAGLVVLVVIMRMMMARMVVIMRMRMARITVVIVRMFVMVILIVIILQHTSSPFSLQPSPSYNGTWELIQNWS